MATSAAAGLVGGVAVAQAASTIFYTGLQPINGTKDGPQKNTMYGIVGSNRSGGCAAVDIYKSTGGTYSPSHATLSNHASACGGGNASWIVSPQHGYGRVWNRGKSKNNHTGSYVIRGTEIWT